VIHGKIQYSQRLESGELNTGLEQDQPA